jgi:hypothetical protein
VALGLLLDLLAWPGLALAGDIQDAGVGGGNSVLEEHREQEGRGWPHAPPNATGDRRETGPDKPGAPRS